MAGARASDAGLLVAHKLGLERIERPTPVTVLAPANGAGSPAVASIRPRR
jgi:hypothetical protein